MAQEVTMTARRTFAAVAFAAPLAVVAAHLLLDRLVAALHDLDAAHAWETTHTPRLPGGAIAGNVESLRRDTNPPAGAELIAAARRVGHRRQRAAERAKARWN